jgi:pSer/pThr/pTyr-binding forkhead associated (FHA) protein
LRVLLTDRLVLGRDCDGLLVADPLVSRHHLELRLVAGEVVARDLGSANGTWLATSQLAGEATLGPGTTVTIGHTTVRLVADAHAPSD